MRNDTKQFLAHLAVLAVVAVALGALLASWRAETSLNEGRGCVGGYYLNKHREMVRGDTHPSCRYRD